MNSGRSYIITAVYEFCTPEENPFAFIMNIETWSTSIYYFLMVSYFLSFCLHSIFNKTRFDNDGFLASPCLSWTK